MTAGLVSEPPLPRNTDRTFFAGFLRLSNIAWRKALLSGKGTRRAGHRLGCSLLQITYHGHAVYCDHQTLWLAWAEDKRRLGWKNAAFFYKKISLHLIMTFSTAWEVRTLPWMLPRVCYITLCRSWYLSSPKNWPTPPPSIECGSLGTLRSRYFVVPIVVRVVIYGRPRLSKPLGSVTGGQS